MRFLKGVPISDWAKQMSTILCCPLFVPNAALKIIQHFQLVRVAGFTSLLCLIYRRPLYDQKCGRPNFMTFLACTVQYTVYMWLCWIHLYILSTIVTFVLQCTQHVIDWFTCFATADTFRHRCLHQFYNPDTIRPSTDFMTYKMLCGAERKKSLENSYMVSFNL